MLRDGLLTLHIFAVIIWMGCGVYERFLHLEIHRARGSAMEIPLLKIYRRYAGVIIFATLVVAVTGGLMIWLVGWGFFNPAHPWLSIKQGIMLAILLGMAWMLPGLRRCHHAIDALPDHGTPVLDDLRDQLKRIDLQEIPIRIGATIAVVLAVFRPGF